MGELLRLGAVELAFSGLGNHLGQRHFHVGGRKSDGQILEFLVVEGHDGKIKVLKRTAGNLRETGVRKHIGQLDLPLTPAAAENHTVPVGDPAHGPAALRQNHRFQMIVVHSFGVGGSDGLRQESAAVLRL